MQRKRITVTGKVQGVFFRGSTLQAAIECGVRGFVKNLQNGNVLVEAEGPEDKVQSFVEWCRLGPSAAQVTNVDIEDIPLQGEQGFRIAYAPN